MAGLMTIIVLAVSITMSTIACAAALYLLTKRASSPPADYSPKMSPDTVSSLFPDRPIRPLPTRRLRERLSPEVADSIKYPPSTHDAPPLFFYPPYSLKDEGSPSSVDSYSPISAEHGRPGRNYTPRRNGTYHRDGEEEEAAHRSTLVTRSPPEILNRAGRRPSRPEQPRHADPQPPLSTASSVDGYDSFENMSNKKKRKIPSAGDHVLNGAHALNNDLGSLAVSVGAHTPTGDVNDDRPSGYPGSGTFNPAGQGISGSGRGRLGLSRNGRSPLRALSDGNNAWAPRTPKSGPQWTQTERPSGIISNAIANAGKLPQGQENVSLLQQHSASNRTTPASSQFTFTCDSQVPGTVQWPGQPTRQNIGTQTASVASSANASQQAVSGSPKAASGSSGNSRRRTQRRLARELNVAARNRRELAADNYYHNPPKLADIWICEFCEYERIFGEPPRALIRDYELKDRRHRQEEADRKRLLEKAKAKSRKGKKSGKAPVKGSNVANNAASQPQPEPVGDPGAPSMHADPSHSTQSEDDYEYEYEDDYSSPPHEHIPPIPGALPGGDSTSSAHSAKT